MASQPIDDTNREFALVVYGATGFTGSLVAEHLCRYYLAEDGDFRVKFALAGRSMSKLQEVRRRVCANVKRQNCEQLIPLIVADSADEESLVRMCSRTRAIVTTVGPYLQYGEPLVRACVDARTHYCDLVGEMPFIVKMSNKYGALAAERGVKIVHCCGFDSVPSDLGVLLAEETALRVAKAPCETVRSHKALCVCVRLFVSCSKVKTAVISAKGSVSGGTIASLLGVSGSDGLGGNPYYLMERAFPEGKSVTRPTEAAPRVRFVSYDKDFGYGAFFVMGALNENVTRWSNALMNFKYGKNFKYHEMVAAPDQGFFTAAFISLFTYLSLFVIKVKPLRSLLFALGVLPKPGEGPSRKTMESGSFEMKTIGRTSPNTASGSRVLRVSVSLGSKQGDPGYHETAKMLAEAGLCMALQLDSCTRLCGVCSPAAGIGTVLKDRLADKGFFFNIETAEEDAGQK
ncbi:saccharopine dehydrogenase [Cystoisospora suis]|uniref:Saccharopine dehydrogenase n=1 Tax=Cystoisospora suis TaxID=483139 RepID=A0A2C6L3L0_9APIC|nr:saccharopine dehydrogenase [Cystoisospora suis]